MNEMVDPALKTQILRDLEQMTPEQQRQAAHSVHSLLTEPPNLPPAPLGKEVLARIGQIDAASAREMREAIVEEFGRIDPSEW